MTLKELVDASLKHWSQSTASKNPFALSWLELVLTESHNSCD